MLPELSRFNYPQLKTRKLRKLAVNVIHKTIELATAPMYLVGVLAKALAAWFVLGWQTLDTDLDEFLPLKRKSEWEE